MADKNLKISLKVELDGVKEVESKLKELQTKLEGINKKAIDKLFDNANLGIKVPIQLTGIEEAQKAIANLKAPTIKVNAVSTGGARAAATASGDTAGTMDASSANFDWKTAIQVAKMKALTPGGLMQIAQRVTSLATSISAFYGILGGVAARTAFTTFTQYTRTLTGALGELKNTVLSLTGLDKMLSVSGITNSMVQMAESTKEIQKQALQTGIAVDALSQYRFAMKQVGVSAENFGSNISYMGKAIVQAATGASIDAGNAFKKLKLDPKQLRTEDTQKQFEQIAKAIAALPSETDKASAALLIFNRSGSQLLPFINKFNEGISESETILGRMPQLIKAYSAEFTQFANNISNLQIKGQQYITGFMQSIVPALNNYLKDFLAIDFTDFGELFSENFQRTVTSLNLRDSVGGLLNSFILDLMDVVDKALTKAIDYAGDLISKIDWSAIVGKVLTGTVNFVINAGIKAGEVFIEKTYNTESFSQRTATEGQIGEFLLELKKQGLTDEESKEILDKIYQDNNINGRELKDFSFSGMYGPVTTGTGVYDRSPKALTDQENKIIQESLLTIEKNNNKINELFQKYESQVGKEQAKVFRDNILKEIINEKVEQYKFDIQPEIDREVREYRQNLFTNRRGFRSEAYQSELDDYRQRITAQRVDEFTNSTLIKELLTYDKEAQQSLINRVSDELSKRDESAQKAIGEASVNLSQSTKTLKDAVAALDQEMLDLKRQHNEYQGLPEYTEQEKLQENISFSFEQSENFKKRLLAYQDAKKVLDATEELLKANEDWIKQNEEIKKGMQNIKNEIATLDSEQKILIENSILKDFSLKADEVERKIKTIKSTLDTLKSQPITNVDDFNAIAETYRQYISALADERKQRQEALGFYQDNEFGIKFSQDVLNRTTDEITNLNNTIQKVSGEAAQWAQSAILESTKATIAQRNTELGQFQFQQVPQWAATDKQKYDYQMQVFDAQIKASEDNIEAIRLAEQTMLDFDPAVRKVKESMDALDKSASDYDQQFAKLMNDLDEARRNSGVRNTSAFRNLEQMRGEEETKNKMARSQKIQAENPSSMAHQMSKSIADASNQMGELTQNVAQGFGNMIMSVRDSLATLISDLLNGTMTIGEAFQKMGQTILQALINTFAQIVANFIMQQTVMRLFQAMTNASLVAEAAALTAIWKTPATLASIASWGGAAAVGKAAVETATAMGLASGGAFAKGGRVKGGEQMIRVNEEGEEFVVSALSPSENEPYLKLANMGYNLDSIFANSSVSEISRGRLNVVNNRNDTQPVNNNINVGLINSRQDKRRWMRREGQRMIVDFLNTHRGALKYA